MKYIFYTINDQTINTYLEAGGLVYINTKLLNIPKTERETGCCIDI